MTLHLQPADPLVFLQLPPRDTKRISQCDIRVRVRRIPGVCMPYDNLLARNGDINLKVKQRPLLVVLVMGRLHDHLALDDLTAEAL